MMLSASSESMDPLSTGTESIILDTLSAVWTRYYANSIGYKKNNNWLKVDYISKYRLK